MNAMPAMNYPEKEEGLEHARQTDSGQEMPRHVTVRSELEEPGFRNLSCFHLSC